MSRQATTAFGELWDYVDSVSAVIRGAPSVVDVHFFKVLVGEELDKARFRRLVEAAEHGEFADMPMSRLRQGPSYIELGAWIGDQGAALRLMAVGQVAGCWTVITPKTLGFEGVDADMQAGIGFVMVSGWTEEA